MGTHGGLGALSVELYKLDKLPPFITMSWNVVWDAIGG